MVRAPVGTIEIFHRTVRHANLSFGVESVGTLKNSRLWGLNLLDDVPWLNGSFVSTGLPSDIAGSSMVTRSNLFRRGHREKARSLPASSS